MFKFAEQKRRVVVFLIAGLSIFSGLCAGDVQNNEYEARLKHAEQIAQKLIKPHIAVFDIHDTTDPKKMTLDLLKIAKDPKINGILLWIDSNGGGAALTSSIHDLLLRVGKIKPIVALVRGNALSAGYYIAIAAHYIFAHSASKVGSVGTVRTISRYKNPKVKENGIEAELEVDTFTAGRYKALGNVYRDNLSEDEKKEIQKEVDAINKVFIANVAHHRNLDIQKADQWADAQCFIAQEAVEIGLIDEVGTAFEAEAKMVELIREKNPEKLVLATVEYIFFDCVTPSK